MFMPDFPSRLPADRDGLAFRGARYAPSARVDPDLEFQLLVSVVTVIDGAVIALFDGLWSPVREMPGWVSHGGQRVKPLHGSSASLRPFG